MKYGQIYLKLPLQAIATLFQEQGKKRPIWQQAVLSWYFGFFGLPDLGNHFQFPQVIAQLKPEIGERILDAGCGNGIYLNTVASDQKINGWGIDINEKFLEKARLLSKSLGLGVKFEKMCLADLKFPDSFFDKIICVQVLQFIKNDKKAIKEMARVIKKGGSLIITFPGKKYYKISKTRREGKEMKHRRNGYSSKEIKQLLNQAGFRIQEKMIITGPLFKKLVSLQNFLYQRKKFLLNLLISPLLLFLAKVDVFLRKASSDEAIYLFRSQKI